MTRTRLLFVLFWTVLGKSDTLALDEAAVERLLQRNVIVVVAQKLVPPHLGVDQHD